MNRNDFLKVMGMASLAPFFLGTKSVNELYKEADTWANTPKMPLLFLGHGSPMNAIEDNSFVQGFKNVVNKIPTPKAILCISAHWETKGTKVTAMNMPRTIHDFGGFPQALYDIEYKAAGSPDLAQKTADLLQPIQVEMDHDWGLDHGAWTVIMHLYPQANIPIVQMSLDYSKSPEAHFELAKKLDELRHKGILIVGSGNILHNLRKINFNHNAKPFDWAIEAKATIDSYIHHHNYFPLLSYDKSRLLRMGIPSPDHFLPLLYILALHQKEKEDLFIFNDEIVYGSISMTSILIG